MWYYIVSWSCLLNSPVSFMIWTDSSSEFISVVCRNRCLDFKSRDLISIRCRVMCVQQWYVLSSHCVGKVCMFSELFVINYSSKKYVEEYASSCNVFLTTKCSFARKLTDFWNKMKHTAPTVLAVISLHGMMISLFRNVPMVNVLVIFKKKNCHCCKDKFVMSQVKTTIPHMTDY